MNKDKLTEKWLIDMLDTMLIYTCATFDVNDEESKEKVRQAYTQIKEIVGEHFKRKDFTKGYEIKQIQQKPTVTEGDIECVLHTLAINHWARKRILSQWLKEVGVEVLDNDKQE